VRRGVNLFELILVLVIVGIVGGFAIYLKPNPLTLELERFYLALLKAKWEGINYDRRFADNLDKKRGCFFPLKTKERVVVEVKEICFNSLGSPIGIKTPTPVVTLYYKRTIAQIVIFPKTGYLLKRIEKGK